MIIPNVSSLQKIAPQYRPVIEMYLSETLKQFAGREHSCYLMGSVGRGDALDGVSDIDFIMVVDGATDAEDDAYFRTLATRLRQEFPFIPKADLEVLSWAELLQDQKSEVMRLVFKTDTVLLRGKDHREAIRDYHVTTELAWEMFRDFGKMIEMIRNDINHPDEDDVNDPEHIPSCMRWISKKVLRLGLGIVMCNEEFYTRSLTEMRDVFTDRYPEHAELMKRAYINYTQPTYDAQSSNEFLDMVLQELIPMAKEMLGDG